MGIIYIIFISRKENLNSRIFLWIFFFTIIYGLFWARIFHELLYSKIFSFSLTGGTSIIGAIIGVLITIYILSNLTRFHWIEYIDIIAPAFMLFQSIGKIGCYLAGCCYGYKCNIFIPKILGINIIFYRFPIQLTESFLLFLGFLIMFIISMKETRTGIIFSLYLIIYGLERFIAEFFRGDSIKYLGSLSYSQIIASIIFAIGLYLFKRFKYD